MISAMLAGFRRAVGSPVILLGLWLANFLVALPAAALVAGSLNDAIGTSRVHERLRAGFDMTWFGEYQDWARGLGRTFTPTVVGAGAFYDNLDAWVTGRILTHAPELLAVGGFYALLWALLLGGALDRFANPAAKPGLARFFRSGGRYFFRFVRLGALSGVFYVFVYLLSRWMFEIVDEATRDVTAEVTVFSYTLLVLGVVALMLTLIHLSFAYAKIAIVLDGRRSALLAALRGAGFVMLHPWRSLGLYYGLLMVSMLLLVVYALMAPGAAQSTPLAVALAFGVGQLYLLVKLFMRLWLYGGQMALYETLTHGTPGGEVSRANPPPVSA